VPFSLGDAQVTPFPAFICDIFVGRRWWQAMDSNASANMTEEFRVRFGTNPLGRIRDSTETLTDLEFA